MMLMLAYIIVGHHEWRTAEIRVFACVDPDRLQNSADELSSLVKQGRLPISRNNIETLPVKSPSDIEAVVADNSSSADLVIAGISKAQIAGNDLAGVLTSYKAANDVLFVYAAERITIE